MTSRSPFDRRRLADALARRAVSLGGISVIASIAAILVVLAVQVVPLFRAPRVRTEPPREVPASGPAAGLAEDEYREVSVAISSAGVHALRLTPGARAEPLADAAALAPGVAAVARSGPAVFALGLADGAAVRAEVVFDVSYGGGGRAVAPSVRLGPRFPLLAAGTPPSVLACAGGPEEFRVAGAPAGGPDRIALVSVAEERPLAGEPRVSRRRWEVPLPDGGRVTALALDSRGDSLFAGTYGGRIFRFRADRDGGPALAPGWAEIGAPVTALGFVLGDRTLVAGGADGSVSTWQLLSGGGEQKLTRIRGYRPHARPVVLTAASLRDKTFVTADAGGALAVHHGTTGRTNVELSGSGTPLALSLSPKGDGLALLLEGGVLTRHTLDHPHPEATLGTLFGRVWYEGYEKPEHVWQSTGGTDDFEPKFGLAPLAFGTLKGTLYALVLAVPLALLSALYVSQFMHPTLRGYVKPAVEVMAALPSVVLGFVAGLWLAPALERVAPGVFLAPWVVPACVLATLVLASLVPARLRRGVRPGTEIVLLVPVAALALLLSFAAGGWLETGLLAGDYRAWLLDAAGLTYDQRNSLVVGIAMGFAVIPVIFSIAEDALSSVPQQVTAASLALGATRWQTAVRVVLPTASAGVLSAVMIGFGRAVGETMIVLMATGNTPVLDFSPFNGFRALSANIAVELPEAPEGGTHFRVLFLAALLLFAVTFAVNTAAEAVRLALRRRYQQL